MRNGAEGMGRNMLNQEKKMGGLKVSHGHELQAFEKHSK